jgi:hypothetical protein
MQSRFILVCVLVIAFALPTAAPAAAQFTCADQYESNNSFGEATSIGPGEYQATICPSVDVDYYRFTVSSGDQVQLSLTNLPDDFDMVLYNGTDGSIIGSSENGSTNSELIRHTAERDGVWYVKVYPYRETASHSPYTLTLSRVATPNPDASLDSLSAQLSDARVPMSDEDYQQMVETIQSLTTGTQCAFAIFGWVLTLKEGGYPVISADDADTCGGTGGDVWQILNKYYPLDTYVDAPAEPDDGQVIVKHSGQCLAVANGSTQETARVVQQTCDGQLSQWWTFVPAGGGYYELIARHSGMCLDVNGGSTENGAALIQYRCHGGDNQLWQMRTLGGGWLQIVSKLSGKCLDVTEASFDDGTPVIQYDCHYGDNQYWAARYYAR